MENHHFSISIFRIPPISSALVYVYYARSSPPARADPAATPAGRRCPGSDAGLGFGADEPPKWWGLTTENPQILEDLATKNHSETQRTIVV